jgi:hypothetical protein
MSAVMNEPDYVADDAGDRERQQDRVSFLRPRAD